MATTTVTPTDEPRSWQPLRGLQQTPAGTSSSRAPKPEIIAGIDASDDAHRVVSVARWMADRLDASLIVVYSVHPSVYVVGRARRQALARGNRVIDELAASHAIDGRVVEVGDPARLVDAVAGDRAALVVVGRRRHRLRAALRGSVSSAILSSIRSPVVIVPPRAAIPADPDASVIFGAESPGLTVAALRAATLIAKDRDGQTDLASVQDALPPGPYALDTAGSPIRFARIGALADDLAALAQQLRAGLLIVGAPPRAPLKSLIRGSVWRRLVKIAPAPVMVVRPASVQRLREALWRAQAREHADGSKHRT